MFAAGAQLQLLRQEGSVMACGVGEHGAQEQLGIRVEAGSTWIMAMADINVCAHGGETAQEGGTPRRRRRRGARQR